MAEIGCELNVVAQVDASRARVKAGLRGLFVTAGNVALRKILPADVQLVTPASARRGKSRRPETHPRPREAWPPERTGW